MGRHRSKHDEPLDVTPADGGPPKRRPAFNWKPLLFLLFIPAALCVPICGGAIYFLANPSVPEPSDGEAGATAKVGDVVVGVESASIGRATATSAGGQRRVANGESLILRLTLKNTNGRSRANYSGWHSDSGVRMHDDVGNSYSERGIATDFGFEARIDGQHPDGATLYADKPLTEVLVFDRPVPDAKFLILTLPASKLGGSGRFKLRIDRALWQPKGG